MIDSLSWMTIAPELVLLGMTCLIALVDLGVKSRLRGLSFGLTIATLLFVAFLEMNAATGETALVGFNEMYVNDPMAAWLKCFSALALAVTLVYARPYAADFDMLRGGELFSLSLFALLGMFVMTSGHHFLVLYLGLELLTLSSYALVALRRDDGVATEAAMKYFVLGAMASGFLLYGLSLVYGATGSLDINTVAQNIGQVQGSMRVVLALGVVFVVAGLAFKLGVVPFHMWVPDVYHGSPTGVTLLIAGAPKLAAFALVMRLLVEALPAMAFDWQQMVALLAVVSLLVGNLAAVAQTNFKRMLAFSTIAQMGFLMLAFVAGIVDGDTSNMSTAYSAGMFYVITYVLTTLATFGVVILMSRQGVDVQEISDLAGLNHRSPFLAVVMGACMFSLAGVPPLVGFYAKLSVLQALLDAGGGLYVGLAVFAVMMSLIGAFYYIRIVKVMYFDAPSQAGVVSTTADVRLVLTVNGALVLVLGLLPSGLMGICAAAIESLLA